MSSSNHELTCLSVIDNDLFLQHKKLWHASFSLLNKLITKNLVLDLLKKFREDKLCEVCTKGKYVRSSFKLKKVVSTSRYLELLHIDLCGSMRVQSRYGKRYVFVIVDDYFRFTWTLFLETKYETHDIFDFCE